jgi:hypothetical protein
MPRASTRRPTICDIQRVGNPDLCRFFRPPAGVSGPERLPAAGVRSMIRPNAKGLEQG